MTDNDFQYLEETIRGRVASRPGGNGGPKSYLAAVLIVTLLLTVWAGICSA